MTETCRRLVCSFLLFCLSTPAARAVYDEFLYGPKEDVVVWGENRADWKEGQIRTSPLIQKEQDRLLALLLPEKNYKYLLLLKTLAPPVVPLDIKAADPFDWKRPTQLEEAVLIREMLVLKQLERPKSIKRLQKYYISIMYRPETRRKNSIAMLLLRRVNELAFQGRAESKELAAATLYAGDAAFSALALNYFSKHAGSLASGVSVPALAEQALQIQDGDSQEEKLLKADLLYEKALALLTGEEPTYSQNGVLSLAPGRQALQAALAAYEKNTPDYFYYALPARLKAIELGLSDEEETIKSLDSFVLLDKSDRQGTAFIQEKYIRLYLKKLEDLHLVKGKKLTGAEQDRKDKLKDIVHHLTTAANIYKIDGRQEAAGRLYRRCYLLCQEYLDDDEEMLAQSAYDVADNAMWTETFDESSFYFDKSFRLRDKLRPLDPMTRDVNDVLGRSYIAKWDTVKAREHYVKAIAALVKLQDKTAPADLSLEKSIAILEKLFQDSGPDRRRQIIAAIQGLADACVNGKDYDRALVADQALLRFRQLEFPLDQPAILAIYWQMAWGQQNALHNKEAADLYGMMIDNYPEEPDNVKGGWHQSRAMCSDLIGAFKQGERDYRKALFYFRRAYKAEKVAATRDHYYWTINDIRWNLATRNLIKTANYDDGIWSCYFAKKKIPLKVYLPDDKKIGFAGDLRAMMVKAIDEWRNFPDSPIKIQYVDRAADADIFVERVTTYDDIPVGSAGRSSAVYVKEKGEDTRQLVKVHIRVYCESYDGVNPPLSDYSKTHLYTLFIHEFGHAIGLPHSPNGLDVMYWKACALKPSSRDMETVRHIYKSNK